MAKRKVTIKNEAAGKKSASAKATTNKKSTTKSSGVLTVEQQTKVRKLLRSKDVRNVTMAIGLLQSAGAAIDDWFQIFTPHVIKGLLYTCDVAIWDTVANALMPFKQLLKILNDIAASGHAKLHRTNVERGRAFVTAALALKQAFGVLGMWRIEPRSIRLRHSCVG